MLAFAGPLRSCLCLERVTVSTFRWTRVPLKTPVLQEAKRHHCWYTSEVARFKHRFRSTSLLSAGPNPLSQAFSFAYHEPGKAQESAARHRPLERSKQASARTTVTPAQARGDRPPLTLKITQRSTALEPSRVSSGLWNNSGQKLRMRNKATQSTRLPSLGYRNASCG